MSETGRQRSAMRKARELCAAESARVAESSDPDRAAYGRACGKVLLAFLEWMEGELVASDPRTATMAFAEVCGAMLANLADVVVIDKDEHGRWCDRVSAYIGELAKQKLARGPQFVTKADG